MKISQSELEILKGYLLRLSDHMSKDDFLSMGDEDEGYTEENFEIYLNTLSQAFLFDNKDNTTTVFPRNGIEVIWGKNISPNSIELQRFLIVPPILSDTNLLMDELRDVRCLIDERPTWLKIPLLHNPNDPMQHAVILIEGTLYFYTQDVDDNLETEEDYKRQGYYKHRLDKDGLQFCLEIVKEAVDEEGNPFCLIVKSASHEKLIRPVDEQVRTKVGYFVSDRHTPRVFEDFPAQKIDIVPYFGKTLLFYLVTNEWKALSNESKSAWVYALLLAYLEQVHSKDLVHTDIHPANICVVDAEKPEFKFIDFDESFIYGEQIPRGRGTPGYLAPEFFKNQKAMIQVQTKDQRCHEEQLAIRDTGERAWQSALQKMYSTHFSRASDVWALSIILLKDMSLDADCIFHGLALAMSDSDPDKRPKKNAMEEVLKTYEARKIGLHG